MLSTSSAVFAFRSEHFSCRLRCVKRETKTVAYWICFSFFRYHQIYFKKLQILAKVDFRELQFLKHILLIWSNSFLSVSKFRQLSPRCFCTNAQSEVLPTSSATFDFTSLRFSCSVRRVCKTKLQQQEKLQLFFSQLPSWFLSLPDLPQELTTSWAFLNTFAQQFRDICSMKLLLLKSRIPLLCIFKLHPKSGWFYFRWV